jgi:integrase
MAGRRKSNPLGLPARVYFQSGAYRYRDRVGKWHLLGRRWDRAAKSNYVEASSENPVPGTMAELINRTLAKYGPDKSPRSRADNEAEAVNLKGFFGRMQPRTVTAVHVAQYRDARCDKHGRKAPVRANRELSLLSTVFAYGLELGWCTINPCRGVRRNRERPRTRNVEQAEYDGFLAFARAQGTTARMLAATAVLTYLTSQRRQDVLALRVSEIRDDGIHVTQLKSGGTVKVVIEWTDALRAAVADARSIERPVASMYLICNRHGQRYTDSGFKAMWNRLQVAWHEAGGTRFHYHDLRARSVGKLKADGRQAKDITGHTTETTAERIYDRRTAKRGKAVE